MIPKVMRMWLPSALLLSLVPVTLENLDLEDAGTYMCGVDKPFKPIDGDLGIDDSFKVVLSVVPSEVPVSSPGYSETTTASPTSSPGHTQPSVTTEDTTPHPSLQPGSLLSSFYFYLLVFLELPLLLSMLSAVLWVNRPQRCSGEKMPWPDYENN